MVSICFVLYILLPWQHYFVYIMMNRYMDFLFLNLCLLWLLCHENECPKACAYCLSVCLYSIFNLIYYFRHTVGTPFIFLYSLTLLLGFKFDDLLTLWAQMTQTREHFLPKRRSMFAKHKLRLTLKMLFLGIINVKCTQSSNDMKSYTVRAIIFTNSLSFSVCFYLLASSYIH